MKSVVWLNDIINLLYPNVCSACGEPLGKQENVICLGCELNLPRTGFHLHDENPVSRVFWGRVKLEAATSFLFFNKGGHVQEMIHALKYKGRKEAGGHLGKLFGADLKKSPLYQDIDLVVPVPLHPVKQHKRGFNQSDVIARGISQMLGCGFDNRHFIRLVNTATQTKKSRYNRWENVKGVFGITDTGLFSGRHILLVDDVLTTGATLEACATVLLETGNARVSVATLAYAQV